MAEAPLVRCAGPDDSDVVCDLVLGFRDHLRATFPTREGLATFLPSALADADLEFYVASEADGSPLGYAHLRFFPSVWALGTESYLEDLFVWEHARGRGVGEALLAFVLERARSRHARAINLTTNERNEAGQSLYRRMGFAPQSHERYVGGREIRWQISLD